MSLLRRELLQRLRGATETGNDARMGGVGLRLAVVPQGVLADPPMLVSVQVRLLPAQLVRAPAKLPSTGVILSMQRGQLRIVYVRIASLSVFCGRGSIPDGERPSVSPLPMAIRADSVTPGDLVHDPQCADSLGLGELEALRFAGPVVQVHHPIGEAQPTVVAWPALGLDDQLPVGRHAVLAVLPRGLRAAATRLSGRRDVAALAPRRQAIARGAAS